MVGEIKDQGLMASRAAEGGSVKSSGEGSGQSAFTLDTSGLVCFDGDEFTSHCMGWPDLDAFTQGYIEALFASQPQPGWFTLTSYGPVGRRYDDLVQKGFSDLSPDTLARIIADCARLTDGDTTLTVSNGRAAWGLRNGDWGRVHGFPPLTVTLGDDGKIHTPEAQ